VTVHCPGFFSSLVDIHGESGSVSFDEHGRISDHTDLRKPVCDRLKHFAERDLNCVESAGACGPGAEQTVDAVLTLTHESFHLKGETDEAVTQCYAVQTVASTSRRLGVAPSLADAIARYYLTRIEPRMPTEYQLPSGCQDGGKLDLAPDRPGWPNPAG
jgi:hypothetical protein